MHNLTFAFRTLFRTPFVTGVAIVSLAPVRGARSVEPRALECARPEARFRQLRPGGRLRDDVQLRDVPGPAEGPDGLHGHCGARGLRGELRIRRPDVEWRRAARIRQLF